MHFAILPVSPTSDKTVPHNSLRRRRTHAERRLRVLRAGIRSPTTDLTGTSRPHTAQNREALHARRNFLPGSLEQVAPGAAIMCLNPASLLTQPECGAATLIVATGRIGADQRISPNQWTGKWRLSADENRILVVAAEPNGNISTPLYPQALCGIGTVLKVHSTYASSTARSAKISTGGHLAEAVLPAVHAGPRSAMSSNLTSATQRVTSRSGQAAKTGQEHP